MSPGPDAFWEGLGRPWQGRCLASSCKSLPVPGRGDIRPKWGPGGEGPAKARRLWDRDEKGLAESWRLAGEVTPGPWRQEKTLRGTRRRVLPVPRMKRETRQVGVAWKAPLGLRNLYWQGPHQQAGLPRHRLFLGALTSSRNRDAQSQQQQQHQDRQSVKAAAEDYVHNPRETLTLHK